MIFRDKNFPKHDCPAMQGGGWVDEYPLDTVGKCICGRYYRVIRPGFADRSRWQRIVRPDTRERAIIEEQEYVPL